MSMLNVFPHTYVAHSCQQCRTISIVDRESDVTMLDHVVDYFEQC